MNTEPNDKLSENTEAGQLRQAVVSGSALSGIRLKVIQAAADCMMKMNVSEEPSDWVKGRIGVKDARRISKGAEHVNELNRRMAIRLRDIADELLPHCR
jgi:hypothetical protein